jgi:hypothetical protein
MRFLVTWLDPHVPIFLVPFLRNTELDQSSQKGSGSMMVTARKYPVCLKTSSASTIRVEARSQIEHRVVCGRGWIRF